MDPTDGVTPVTGITLGAADQAEALKANGAATVDISGATWAAVTGAAGWYDLSLTTSHTDTVGELVIVVQDASAALPVYARFQVVAASVYNRLWASSAVGPLTSPETANAVWDATQSGHTTAGSFGEIATEIASILVDTGTDIPALIAALNDLSAAQVNAEVVDVMATDTHAMPAQGAPPAAPTYEQILTHFWESYRNKLEQTATEFRIYDDAGTTVQRKAAVSDDGTTTTVGEIATGP